MNPPKISVVIPTYNRCAQLERVLLGFVAQDLPPSDFEIIVVSDGSTDGTDEYLAGDSCPLDVVLVRQENQGPGVARNNGVEKSAAAIVLFVDDDVVPAPELVRVHLERHAEADERTVIIGPLLTPEDTSLEPWVEWEQRMLYKQYDAMARGDWSATARQFYTGNASLGRALFEESGGFDPTYRRGEDVELSYRLAGLDASFEFDPSARAFHHASRSYESWLSIAASYGGNDVKLWRDHGQRWLLPAARAEWGYRNPLTRFYTRRAMTNETLRNLLSGNGAEVTNLLERFGLGRAGQAVLSAIYNATYYQGLAEELGSFDDFLDLPPVPAPLGPG